MLLPITLVRLRLLLIFATFAMLTANQPSKGEESLQLPTLVLPKSGFAQDIPKDLMPPTDAPSVDALSSPVIGRALISLFKDTVPRTRSRRFTVSECRAFGGFGPHQ